MEQLELQGISLQYSAFATKPEGVETVDMSGMMSQTLEVLANNTWNSGTFTIYRGKPVGFSYRIQKGQLSKYITNVEVSIDGVSGVEQSDGSYKLTYDAGSTYNLGGRKITVNIQTRGGNSDWLANSYSYGDLLGMIEFYDAENLVFYDGAGYADHCQLKLIKTVGVPAIQIVMTAPNYEERYESTATIQGDMYIPLLANEYTTALGANNPDFVALSDTIRILEGARNSVLPAGSDPFYQPYQIDASIEFNWSTEKLPILAMRRMAGIKPALCPVLSDGVQVQWKISGAQQQQNKSAELYDQQGQYGQHLPAVYHAKQRGSAVLSALPTVYEKCTGRNPKFLGHHQEQQRHRQVGGHGRPHHSKRHGPGGNLCQRTARAHHSYL